MISPTDNLEPRISIFVLSQNLFILVFHLSILHLAWGGGGAFKINGIYMRHFKVCGDKHCVFELNLL